MKKFFGKDKKKEKKEQEESMRLKDMPPPPTVPQQDPRYSQRGSNTPMGHHSDYNLRVQQQQYDEYRPAAAAAKQQHRSLRLVQRLEEQPPSTRQHSQNPPRYREEQGYDGPHATSQTREVTYDASPPRKPPPPSQQQQQQQHHGSVPAERRSSRPQEFQPTKAPPAKEKAPPPKVSNMDPSEQMERAAVTRELVKQYVADIWNRGDLNLIPKVCARGLRFNGSAGMDRVGHDGFARMVETIRGSLEDYHCEIHSMVVEGNKAFCRMRFTGRHTGQLLGYEATGTHVSWMGASEFTVMDGLIVKVWELGDMASLEHQLREAGGSTSGQPVADDGDC